MLKIVVSVSSILLGLACSRGWAADRPLIFDSPLHEDHITLPPISTNPQDKAVLSCFYYPHLMVKQIDTGEIGGATLSMTYVSKEAPACRQAKSKDEKIINTWMGYFRGVKGEYVFFNADDGVNGGMGFAVFKSSRTDEIFSDVAGEIYSIILMTPMMDDDKRPHYENPITLRYQRVYLAPCSLRSDEKRCWDLIKQYTGLTERNPPDCSSYDLVEKEYFKEKMTGASLIPSVIKYSVEVVLDGLSVIRVTPIFKATECYAAD